MTGLKLQRRIALVQVVIGCICVILVVIGYAKFAKRITNALTELDQIANSAELELDTTASVLASLAEPVASVGTAMEKHAVTLDAARATIEKAKGTLKVWEDQFPGIAQVSTNLADVCDSYQKHLPIEVPNVKVTNESIPLVTIVTNSKPYNIKVPMPNLETAEENLSHTIKFDRLETRVLRQTVGFNIPDKEVQFTFDKLQLVRRRPEKSVEVPLPIPELKMTKRDFPVVAYMNPNEPTRKIGEQEKEALVSASKQLKATADVLEETKGTLGQIRGEMFATMIESINATGTNIRAAEKACNDLHERQLPALRSAIADQKRHVHGARNVFSALSNLVPLGGIVLVIIPFGFTLSGISNWLSIREP